MRSGSRTRVCPNKVIFSSCRSRRRFRQVRLKGRTVWASFLTTVDDSERSGLALTATPLLPCTPRNPTAHRGRPLHARTDRTHMNSKRALALCAHGTDTAGTSHTLGISTQTVGSIKIPAECPHRGLPYTLDGIIREVSPPDSAASGSPHGGQGGSPATAGAADLLRALTLLEHNEAITGTGGSFPFTRHRESIASTTTVPNIICNPPRRKRLTPPLTPAGAPALQGSRRGD